MDQAHQWLLRAARGAVAGVPDGLATAMLAQAASSKQDVGQLNCGQMLRGMLHAAVAAKQAEVGYLAVLSAASMRATVQSCQALAFTCCIVMCCCYMHCSGCNYTART